MTARLERARHLSRSQDTSEDPRDRENVLLIIPTYNEVENIERLLKEIDEQRLPLDILVIDDNSPDGTGTLLEQLARCMPLTIIHRSGKLGIGSAHKHGFQHAIARGYRYALTMDADFSHAPSYLPAMLAWAASADVVIGSRYIEGGGLSGWSMWRRVVTHTAHGLTRYCLKMPYDCTGGFRLYRTDVLRAIEFNEIRSDGYAFLIEMLYHVTRQKFSVHEMPIVINSRHKGRSKISRTEILHAIKTLGRLHMERWLGRSQTRGRLAGAISKQDGQQRGQMDWDDYWLKAQGKKRHGLYQVIAELYRRQLISRSAARILSRYCVDESNRQYLHAGCGSGGSDQRITWRKPVVHQLDISLPALQLNRSRSMAMDRRFVCGDLFALPYRDGTIDGIFNFGVMEHFTAEDIDRILAECRRVLKPDGRIILFWPPNFGLSVIVLTSFLKVISAFRKQPLVLYPDEISRVKSFRWVRDVMARSRFRALETAFSWRDLFTYVVVVAHKEAESTADAEQPTTAKTPFAGQQEAFAIGTTGPAQGSSE